jgi:UDP-N-acetylmuramoyl-L-alanyl-D-glutamate--2,6-diaminopimelate ligase
MRPEHPLSRSLTELIDEFDLELRGDADGIELTGLSLGSDTGPGAVQPGDLYVAVSGSAGHGASFASAARDAGAVAVLTDEAGAHLAAPSGLPVIITIDGRAALGVVAAWFYRTIDNPAVLFAVTGTDGRTSVLHLLAAILAQLGVECGHSSRAGHRVGEQSLPALHAEPNAAELHALLARMREAELRAIGVEVSASALRDRSVDGLVFEVAGFTNLRPAAGPAAGPGEDVEADFQTTLELFSPEHARRAVVSIDSDFGRRIVNECRIPVTTLSAHPGGKADWHLSVTAITADTALTVEFTLEGPDGRRLQSTVPLPGRFMAANAALAIVMLVESGFDLEAINHTLARDGGIVVSIPGRAERISDNAGPAVYLDFGRAPEAVARFVASVRAVTPGRLTVVCDPGDDNVDPDVLVDAGADAVIVSDQQSALRSIVLLAEEGDTIIYAGTKAEDYHENRGEKVSYSARDDSRAALREAGWL